MMWQQVRLHWSKRHAQGALRDYLNHPLPNSAQDYRQASYLVLDLETTGLDATRDEVISVGMVAIDHWRVKLSTAQHLLVKPQGSVSDSAVYHGIVDGQLVDANPFEAVLPSVLAALQGRVLVAHGASIELGFLGAACQRLYGGNLVVPTVDTMRLGMRLYRLENTSENMTLPEGSLRLHTLGEKFGLPAHPAHNALNDAVATAELFLAMASHLAGNQPLPVRRLLAG